MKILKQGNINKFSDIITECHHCGATLIVYLHDLYQTDGYHVHYICESCNNEQYLYKKDELEIDASILKSKQQFLEEKKLLFIIDEIVERIKSKSNKELPEWLKQ